MAATGATRWLLVSASRRKVRLGNGRAARFAAGAFARGCAGGCGDNSTQQPTEVAEGLKEKRPSKAL